MKKHHATDTAPSCPCGSNENYDACCGRWHAGPQALQAPTPESLMRSRYAAFVLDQIDYLLATWHPTTRPSALEPNPPGTQWLGLDIRFARCDGPDRGEVAFVARRRLNGKADRLHEHSRFVKEGGRWLYLDGDMVEKKR